MRKLYKMDINVDSCHIAKPGELQLQCAYLYCPEHPEELKNAPCTNNAGVHCCKTIYIEEHQKPIYAALRIRGLL